MFRVLSQTTRRTISLNRCLKSSSSCVQRKNEEINLGEENESSQLKSRLADLSSSASLPKLKTVNTDQSSREQLEPTSDSNASEPRSHSNASEQGNDSNATDCDTVEDWLSTIRPQLAELSPDELNTIYVRMMRLFRRQKETMPADTLLECKKELTKSPDYWQLIDRTKDSMSELTNVALINLLRWFSMTGESMQSPLYLDTCDELHGRVNRSELSAGELVEALFVMHFHVNGPFADQQLVQAARSMLLQGKRIDDVDTITKCIFLFLMPDYDEQYLATKRLIRRLLSPKVQLNFRQSVLLLRRIKQSSELNSVEIRRNQVAKNYQTYTKEGRINRRKKTSSVVQHFPKKLAGLIDKCNAVIHRQLTEEPTSENFDFFLSRLHDSVDPINHEFTNFYPLNLLAPVRDFLLTSNAESANGQRRYDLVLYNLITNYYKMSKFDEALLRRLYEVVCSSEQLRSELADPAIFYYLISNHRLPWVQHDLLAGRLFGDLCKSESKLSTTAARLLSELILNDVQDERLLDYVCDQIRNLSSYRVSSNEYKKVALARVYFSMFGQPKSVQLKQKIDRKLNQIIFDYAGNKPKLSEKYIRYADSKVQKNGFLSNGMYVKGFGIYDRQEADFVSLADHEKYFTRIDRMPIKEHQEL